jgi:hypothetical protein
MTDIVKFSMVEFLHERRKIMLHFDDYMERVERRRKSEREEKINETLLQGLKKRTRKEVENALLEGLIIPLGVKSIVF